MIGGNGGRAVYFVWQAGNAFYNLGELGRLGMGSPSCIIVASLGEQVNGKTLLSLRADRGL